MSHSISLSPGYLGVAGRPGAGGVARSTVYIIHPYNTHTVERRNI